MFLLRQLLILLGTGEEIVNESSPTFSGDWETGDDAASAGIVDLISTGAFPANGSTIEFNSTDDNAGDRSAELATLTVGSTVRFESVDGDVRMVLTSGNATSGTYDYSSGSYGTPTPGALVTVSFFVLAGSETGQLAAPQRPSWSRLHRRFF